MGKLLAKATLAILLMATGALAVGLGPSAGVNQLDTPLLSKTVATLPACNAASEGAQYIVTDALVPALSVAVGAGGAVHVQVTCISTAWKVTGI